VLRDPFAEEFLDCWGLLSEVSPCDLGGFETAGKGAGIKGLGDGLFLVNDLGGPESVGNLGLSGTIRCYVGVCPDDCCVAV